MIIENKLIPYSEFAISAVPIIAKKIAVLFFLIFEKSKLDSILWRFPKKASAKIMPKMTTTNLVKLKKPTSSPGISESASKSKDKTNSKINKISVKSL